MRALLIHEIGFFGVNHSTIKQLHTKTMGFSTVYEPIVTLEVPKCSAGGRKQYEIPKTWWPLVLSWC
jgi:hypothetical protein